MGNLIFFERCASVLVSTLEEYHLIHRLDMYVVDKVCQHMVDARERGRKIIPVSLNFSRLDFDSLNLAEEVENCLKKYNIKKSDIHIEITESTLSEDDIKLKEELKHFRSHGYALWLDDFGSGYSSLNILKDFSFDMMKLDMKFLIHFSENQKTRPIISTILELAKKIGMQTLSEGVESKDVLNYLREIGCQQLQGYLFGKPMPKEEFKAKIVSGEYKISKTNV